MVPFGSAAFGEAEPDLRGHVGALSYRHLSGVLPGSKPCPMGIASGLPSVSRCGTLRERAIDEHEEDPREASRRRCGQHAWQRLAFVGGWHRWTILAMLAHAFLAVMAATERLASRIVPSA